MKKIIIFLCLFGVLNAESKYTFSERQKEILSVPKEIYVQEVYDWNETKKKIDKLNNYKPIKINLGIGLNTTHINMYKDDYEFYENNHIFTLELERNKELIGISHFTNSFNNESLAVYYGIVKDNNNKGFYGTYKVGLVKGYHSKEYLPSKNPKFKNWEITNYNVFYKDYGILLSCGFGYKINENINLECNLLGNAIITGVKLSY